MKAKDVIEENAVPLDSGDAVKVLSEKTENDDNFQNGRLKSELVPARIGNLADEVSGGVKVLSEKTGNDENFQNDNK